MYKVLWDKRAVSDLKGIDKKKATELVKKLEKHLKINPLELGKKLTGQFKGFLRYRYGDYRVIYQVYNKDVTVVIIKVGHRSDIYRGNT
jgi:mRNA interferase RelE/StbE